MLPLCAAAHQLADARPYRFDIASPALSPALLQFARATGVSLLVAKRDLAGLQAPPIQGVMTASEALALLLSHTTLGFKFVATATVSISTAHPRPGHLQQQAGRDDAGLPDDDSGGKVAPLEEIIITSRRRSEDLQRVPIAVTVLTQEQVDKAEIRNLQDVALRAPGLSVSYFSLGQPIIHMRGIGSNDDGAALDNSVVLILDDVYVGRISTIDINMLDVERIEVLRGPQGTLYGKNAIGGAINLSSALPSDQRGVNISASLGNLNYRQLNARLNSPLGSPSLLGRLALGARQRDGWQENLVLGGQPQHDNNNYSLRAKLLYQPRDDLEWYIAYDHSEDDLNSSGRIPVVGRVPVRVLGEDGAPSGESRLPTDLFAALGGDPTHATNQLAGFTERTIEGITSRVSLVRPNYRFTSITGYRDSNFEWLEDSTGLPVAVTDQTVVDQVDETHRQFSQELRWSSGDEGGRNFVAGVFYLHEDTDRDERFHFPQGTARTRQENSSDSFALFGETSFHIDHATRLTLGGRYTYDKKELDQQSVNGGAPAILLEDFTLNARADWHDFSPSAALSWQPRDNLMLFARVARGFKNGGFQGAPGTLAAAQREIDPESAWDYEIGLKSRWYQNRLQLNVVGFYTRYKDLQVVQFRTVDNFGVFDTSNAASADLKGVEAEFALQASAGLGITASYAWLDARYNRFNDVEGRDFTDNQLSQAPRHSLNLAAQYQWRGARGEIDWRLDYRYQSRNYHEPDNDITVQPTFDLLDASMTFYPQGSHWEIRLWTKNLLDEEYIAHLYVLGGNDYALFGTPRTYGVSIRWSTL